MDQAKETATPTPAVRLQLHLALYLAALVILFAWFLVTSPETEPQRMVGVALRNALYLSGLAVVLFCVAWPARVFLVFLLIWLPACFVSLTAFYLVYAWGRVDAATVVRISWGDFSPFAAYIVGLCALLLATRVLLRPFRT